MKKAQSTEHETHMHRCLQLAEMGAGIVSPNPMVGAVLVHNGRIIGEGYHQQFGGPHAEVHCLQSVRAADRALIPASTLYVNLEPCSHHGKTPPCTQLILQHSITRVVVACRDSHNIVAGKGIAQLINAGVEVTEGVLEGEARFLNRRFLNFHTHQMPYVVLKWAQSADGYLGKPGMRTKISNEFSDRLVHRWRSEEQSILIGRKTAAIDDPELTVRLANGKNPLRMVMDPDLKLPTTLKIFNSAAPTIIFNLHKHEHFGNLQWVKLELKNNSLEQVLRYLHSQNILSVLVEGGEMLLNSFLDAQLWNEIRVIKSPLAMGEEGVKAPLLHMAPADIADVAGDRIETYYRQ